MKFLLMWMSNVSRKIKIASLKEVKSSLFVVLAWTQTGMLCTEHPMEKTA